jgi:ethanolamine transporter EutH
LAGDPYPALGTLQVSVSIPSSCLTAGIIAQEITDELEAALQQFEVIAEDLK